MDKRIILLHFCPFKYLVCGLLAVFVSLEPGAQANAGRIKNAGKALLGAGVVGGVVVGAKVAVSRALERLASDARVAVDMAYAHDPAYAKQIEMVEHRLSFYVISGPHYVSYALRNAVEQDRNKLAAARQVARDLRLDLDFDLPSDVVSANSPPPCHDPDIQHSYDRGSPDYHSYSHLHIICTKKQRSCTRASVFTLMLSQKRFVAPTLADSPVRSCEVVLLPDENPLSEHKNPVTTVVNPSHYSVTNYTRPGHAFHPGKITRTVVDMGNAIGVRTDGEGTGPRKTKNAVLAVPIWEGVDTELKVQWLMQRAQ